MINDGGANPVAVGESFDGIISSIKDNFTALLLSLSELLVKVGKSLLGVHGGDVGVFITATNTE